jgi:excisionase family DNA binding protein
MPEVNRKMSTQDAYALPLKQAADAVGLSHWTLRKMIRQGILPVVRINRKILIEPDALRSLVESHRSTSLHDPTSNQP